MPRLTKDPLNLWGRPTLNGAPGLELQRSDLWVLNLDTAIQGLTRINAYSGGFDTSTLQVASVGLPTLSVKADEFRRDSRPVLMPGFDEAVSPVKMAFNLDAAGAGKQWNDFYSSNLYHFISTWLNVTRSGRNAISLGDQAELGESNFMDENYRVPYRYNLLLKFGRGNSDGSTLEVSTQYELRSAWPISMQLSEVSYDKPGHVQLVCQFGVSEVVQYVPPTAP